MHVSWPELIAVLTGGNRSRTVREAWTRHADPYGAPAARRPDPVDQALRGAWCGAPVPAANAGSAADRLAAWMSGHQVRDAGASSARACVGELVIRLPIVFEATIDGVPSTLLMYVEPEQPAAPTVDLMMFALSHLMDADGSRRPAVLDVHRETLLTEPLSVHADERLTHGCRDLTAMWHRFDRLAGRMNIYSYLPVGTDIPAWDLRQIPWSGVRDVTDVGCGTGRHLDRLARIGLRLVGVDPSIGAVARAASDTTGADIAFVVGELAHLPVADHSADVVLAMHMLYNVDDIDRGLSEARRVLRPDGRLLATTSAPDHLIEFADLYERAVRSLCPALPAQWHQGAPLLRRFDLDNGPEVLRRHFRSVERRDLVLPLVYPDGEPVIRNLDTTRTWREPHLPPGILWATVMAEVRRQIGEIIAAHGAFRATLREGALICVR